MNRKISLIPCCAGEHYTQQKQWKGALMWVETELNILFHAIYITTRSSPPDYMHRVVSIAFLSLSIDLQTGWIVLLPLFEVTKTLSLIFGSLRSPSVFGVQLLAYLKAVPAKAGLNKLLQEDRKHLADLILPPKQQQQLPEWICCDTGPIVVLQYAMLVWFILFWV